MMAEGQSRTPLKVPPPTTKINPKKTWKRNPRVTEINFYRLVKWSSCWKLHPVLEKFS